jgi:hypothetical protein
MKTTKTLGTVATGILALGLFAALPAVAQNAEQDAKIKIKENKIKIKGKDAVEAAREMLAPEVTSTFVEGYTVPTEYHTHFTELPPVEENVVIRYRAGRAYYIDQDSWKIVRVVTVNPALQAESETTFVEGSVIPEAQRTTLVELPQPDANLTVRYYNDTAYYMDPEYRIVRTVRLAQ